MSKPTNILLPYQKRYVADQSRFVIVEKSRRIGLTWCHALWSVRRRLTRKIDETFCSANAQTGKEYIRNVKDWCRVLNIAIQSDFVEVDEATTEQVTLPNGSRIISVSSNPTALRGRGSDITWDEAAFHEHAEEWFTAAQPLVIWGGGSFRVISTHNGTTCLFYQLVKKAKEANSKWKHYKITLLDAVEEGLATKVAGDHQKLLPDLKACNEAFIESIKQTCLNDDAFGQEFLCEVGEAKSIVSTIDYDKCVFPYEVLDELDFGKTYAPLYIGIDVGRHNNYTVIWVVEEGLDAKAPEHLQRCYRTVAMKVVEKTGFAAQQEIMERFISHPSVYKCCIDAVGIGMSISEDLYEKFGSTVEPFKLTSLSKSRVVERVKKYISQTRVSLPDDLKTKQDICSMRRYTSAHGNIKYEGNAGDSHADRFMALSLALEAAESTDRLVLVGSSNT